MEVYTPADGPSRVPRLHDSGWATQPVTCRTHGSCLGGSACLWCRGIVLRHLDVDTIRDRLERGAPWREIPVAEIEIGAALELAVALEAWCQRTTPPADLARVELWSRKVDAVAEARYALRGGRSDEDRRAPDREFLPLGNRAALVREGALFFDRFARSLREHAGVPAGIATAVSRAAMEMAENAIQHSGLDETSPAPGVVAFHVVGTRVKFAVADCGRGVRASLATSEQWQHLATAGDALDAAVLHRASRWSYGQGNGFRELLDALADQAGRLRFASDDAVLGLEGTAATHRVKRVGRRRSLHGLQLSVSMEFQSVG